ncbi:PREDICTED: glutamyl-tRNA(Gln) amidotransferase subunit B, mitochondrial-like, partial [Rhagoletis zephyria]|uniref:glutamyl-tRNA(Gln) amidotransferase subunit B, mitochondrial-like n=1 Tax=Rhagoletis zephyria TaxID=28612 RepID=UPI000811A712
MPNGYQITQQRAPIARDGLLEFVVYDEYNDHLLFGGSSNPTAAQLKSRQHLLLPYLKRCQLKQLQLEQDSGKSLADDEEEDGEGDEGETSVLKSSCARKQRLIDLNRAGVPLLEFVFEPQLTSSLEAASLVRELILRLQAIDVCSCRLAEGALRVDANVSIRPRGGSPTLGTRTEIKNLNSLRFLREAIDYEIGRQAELLTAGGAVVNETLGFDFRSRRTYPMRDKEIVQDYRFMPEPNLPPVLLRNSAEDENQTGDKDLLDIAAIADELTSFSSSSSSNSLPQQ